MIINYNSMANNNISMLMCMIIKLLQLISHDKLGDFIMIVMMMISYCHSNSYTCSLIEVLNQVQTGQAGRSLISSVQEIYACVCICTPTL